MIPMASSSPKLPGGKCRRIMAYSDPSSSASIAYSCCPSAGTCSSGRTIKSEWMCTNWRCLCKASSKLSGMLPCKRKHPLLAPLPMLLLTPQSNARTGNSTARCPSGDRLLRSTNSIRVGTTCVLKHWLDSNNLITASFSTRLCQYSVIIASKSIRSSSLKHCKPKPERRTAAMALPLRFANRTVMRIYSQSRSALYTILFSMSVWQILLSSVTPCSFMSYASLRSKQAHIIHLMLFLHPDYQRCTWSQQVSFPTNVSPSAFIFSRRTSQSICALGHNGFARLINMAGESIQYRLYDASAARTAVRL